MADKMDRGLDEIIADTVRSAARTADYGRLAEDLHDGIGTMLSVTKMSLNQLERQLNGNTTMRLSLQVQKTRSMIDETMTNVRRISRDLVPTTLERFGLLPALEELADRATDTELEVHLEGVRYSRIGRSGGEGLKVSGLIDAGLDELREAYERDLFERHAPEGGHLG